MANKKISQLVGMGANEAVSGSFLLPVGAGATTGPYTTKKITTKELEILSCWINDMKEGEYNPPHTHHDNTGWSSVMFLKVPEFVNDVKDPHKYKDGFLGFTDVNGTNMTWMEPKVGHFYIFEARHQHCVMPFKTKIKEATRRSMSFNFIQKINSDDK